MLPPIPPEPELVQSLVAFIVTLPGETDEFSVMVMGELPLCVSSSVTVSPDKNVAAPAAFMSYQAPAAVQSASPEPQFKFCVKTMFPLVTGVSPVMPAVGVAVSVIVSAAE